MEMRRVYMVAGAVAAIALLLIVVPIIVGALLTFLFIGVIPGTDIKIPAWAMMPLFVAGAVTAVRWLLAHPTYPDAVSYRNAVPAKVPVSTSSKRAAPVRRRRATIAEKTVRTASANADYRTPVEAKP